MLFFLFYREYKDIYNRYNVTASLKGLPDMNTFLSLVTPYRNSGGCIVIFDDIAGDSKNTYFDFTKLFTVLCHHLNITVVLILHNIFEKHLHTISLNTHHFIFTDRYGILVLFYLIKK